MVNVEKSVIFKYAVSELSFYGADADRVYSLLERLYTLMQGIEVDLYEPIPDGTLIFKDELAVLEKLFQ